MFHLIPDKYKKAYTFQMIMLITLIVSGFTVLPIFVIAYVFFYKWNKKVYKVITNRTCYFIWIHFTYIAQWWNGLRLKMYASDEDLSHVGKEHALIIMNHKYDIDWLATWMFAEGFGVLGGGLSFAKKSLKYVPIIGWIWQFNGTIFLERNWEKDKRIIDNGLKDFSDAASGYYNVLLLYPEGTRFTPKKLEASNEFARSKGLPEMKHCLQIRTRGFVEVIKNLRPQIDVIYDLTIGFPDSVSPSVAGVNTAQPPFTMSNILTAKVKEGDLAFQRILMKDLPETDEEVSEWLKDRFRQKDQLFEHYVQSGKFKGPSRVLQPSYFGLVIHTIVTICIWVPLSYWIFTTILNSTWVIRSVILAVVISVSFFIQLMMNVTRADKGSEYGSKKSK